MADAYPTVRNAVLEDAEVIAEIHVRAWQVGYRGIMPDAVLDNLSIQERTERWTKRLAEDPGWSLVIEQDGQICGWATCAKSRDDAGPNVGELTAIYLDPSTWHKGLGTLIYAEAERRLKEAGFTECIVWVLEPNVRARGFYSSLGYALDGATETWQRDGAEIPKLRYRKKL